MDQSVSVSVRWFETLMKRMRISSPFYVFLLVFNFEFNCNSSHLARLNVNCMVKKLISNTGLFKLIVGVQLSSGNSTPNSGINHHLTIPFEGGFHSFMRQGACVSRNWRYESELPLISSPLTCYEESEPPLKPSPLTCYSQNRHWNHHRWHATKSQNRHWNHHRWHATVRTATETITADMLQTVRTAIETVTADMLQSEPPLKQSPLTCYKQLGTNSIIVLMFVELQRVHI